MKIEVLIMSDLHLGSPNSKTDKILKVLKKYDFNTLILNGDILDSDKLGRLKKCSWKVLSEIRKISKNKKVIYIKGNHDWLISEVISDLLGLELVNNYLFKLNNKFYYFTHGAEFDLFITKNYLITEIACWLYYTLQKFDWTHGKITSWLKKQTKDYLKNASKIKTAAVAYSNNHKYEYTFVGHSHYAEIDHNYLNTGSFTDEECHYGLITSNGDLKLVNI